MTDRQTNYNSIDLVKFIMAFAVVAIHTNPLKNCTQTFINNIYNNFVALAVPFFFLAGGYLLSLKLNYPFSEIDIIKIKKQLIKIVKLYLLWMIIYTPLALCNYFINGTSFIKFCLGYIRNLIFVGEQYNSWPLWYLLSTVYSFVLIIILIKLKITPKGLLIISLVFAFISFGTDWFIGTTMELPTLLRLLQKAIKLSIGKGRIFGGMIYIPLGMLLAHRKLNLPANILMFIVGFAARSCFENSTVNSFLLVLTAVGFFGIIEQIKMANNFIYPILRKSSTVIYLIHMYVWTFYYFIVYREKTYGMDSFLVTSTVSLIVSLLYIVFRNKFNNNRLKKNIVA